MALIFEINKLGAIRDSNIKFKPLLIFTGQSNSGKSYAAFLIYYVLKHISELELLEFINKKFPDEIKVLKSFNEAKIVIEEDSFNKWLNDNVSSYMKYLLNSDNINYSGKIYAKFDKIELNFSVYEENVNNKKTTILVAKNLDKQYYLQSVESVPYFVSQIFSENLSEQILGSNLKNTLFLPPSKSALVNINSVNTDFVNLGMYKEFLKDYGIIKALDKSTFWHKIPNTLKKNIKLFMENILGGSISEINNELYFSFSNVKIPISAAASSIKELAPFIIAINKYPASELSILFEEPESHLHPTMQLELAKLIALLHNHQCFFQITTHSDLFISQINNLIRLNNLKKNNKKLFNDYIEKFNFSSQHALSTENIGAYLFKKNEKGITKILQQNIENGISLDSMDSAVENLYNQTVFLDNITEKNN